MEGSSLARGQANGMFNSPDAKSAFPAVPCLKSPSALSPNHVLNRGMMMSGGGSSSHFMLSESIQLFKIGEESSIKFSNMAVMGSGQQVSAVRQPQILNDQVQSEPQGTSRFN